MNTKQIVIPNVTINACKLRRSYAGNYGQQFGALLSGEGLDKLGLKKSQDGGYWYSTKAEYNGKPVAPRVDIIQDIEGNNISDDLADGSVAHCLFELKEYPAGKRADGTKYEAGTNVKLIAVRATDFKVKRSAQDALTAALLEMNIETSASPKTADMPF